MRIDVEELREAKRRRLEIDNLDIHDIEWYENGVKLEFSGEQLSSWKFIGLGNSSFVTYYIDEPERISIVGLSK